jgi:hypothetical protein
MNIKLVEALTQKLSATIAAVSELDARELLSKYDQELQLNLKREALLTMRALMKEHNKVLDDMCSS